MQIKTHGSESRGQVKYDLSTMSYLHKQTILIEHSRNQLLNSKLSLKLPYARNQLLVT